MAIVSNKKRIRRDYAPLVIATSVECATPQSPVTQLYNALDGVYEPNRTLNPTVLRVKVMASAPDRSFGQKNADGSYSAIDVAAQLADCGWYINGERDDTGRFGVHALSTRRYEFLINKNIPIDSNISIVFKGIYTDPRLGVNIPIETKPIVLSTAVMAEDQYSMAISEPEDILYNPFADKLNTYEYKVVNGKATEDAFARASATDANSYNHPIKVVLYKGTVPVPSSDSHYFMRLYKKNQRGELEVCNTTNAPELVSFSNGTVVIDKRKVEKGQYLIRAFKATPAHPNEEYELAKIPFNISRFNPPVEIELLNSTGIEANEAIRKDKCVVKSHGRIIDCPEAVMDIKWYTSTAAAGKQDILQATGSEVAINLASTGVGTTNSDSYVDIYVTAEFKANPTPAPLAGKA